MIELIDGLPDSKYIILKLNEVIGGIYLVIDSDSIPVTTKFIAIDYSGCVYAYGVKPILNTNQGYWTYNIDADVYEHIAYIANVGKQKYWVDYCFEIEG